mmetsp:Transcript_25307/g.60195  ORF Transcript_25307/g.60195 Transcript_25307/m.60195 type:complete len:151 (-) Transcript_25307:176-628(-)
MAAVRDAAANCLESFLEHLRQLGHWISVSLLEPLGHAITSIRGSAWNCLSSLWEASTPARHQVYDMCDRSFHSLCQCLAPLRRTSDWLLAWLSQEWPVARRLARPFADCFFSATEWMSSCCTAVSSWLCPRKQPVRMARVRRHDEHNALI